MSTIRQRLSGFEFSGLGIPFLVLLIMAMLVVPLHPMLLDIFFTFNILVSVVVIMIAIGTKKTARFFIVPLCSSFCNDVTTSAERGVDPSHFSEWP